MPVRDIDEVQVDLGKLKWKDEVLKIDQLMIDATYQRHIVQRLVDVITAGYNPLMAGKIVVSHRNGHSFIVDGQQRWHGARGAGIDRLAAIGITGLEQVDEARLFLALNEGRVAVRAIDNFRAAFVGGEVFALEITDVVEARGGQIQGIRQPGKDNDIQAVESLRWIYRRGGRRGLEETLDVVVEAFGELTQQSCPGLLTKGIFSVLSFHREQIEEKRLARQIAKVGPVQLASLAHGMGQVLGAAAGQRSYYMAILQTYNERLGKSAVEPVATMNRIKMMWEDEGEDETA